MISVAISSSVSEVGADPRTAIALRYELPAPVHFARETGYSMFGGSASVRFREALEVDVGWSWVNEVPVLGHLHARAGLSKQIATGRRWAVRVPIHGGVIWAPWGVGGVDRAPSSPLVRSKIIAVTSGLEATAWFGEVGFQLRAVAFAGPQFGTYETWNDGYEMGTVDRFAYGGSLSAGVSVGW